MTHIEDLIHRLRDTASRGVSSWGDLQQEAADEIERLAQPVQEPVAWMNPSWVDPDTRGWQSDSFESIPIEGWLPLYTASAQRKWIGLTDEEYDLIWRMDLNHKDLINQTIAKLKEKNNG